jgi:hypothetical protein
MTLKASGGPREVTLLACLECGRDIDVCAFCDEARCGAALCYRCVNRLLYLASDSHQDDG